MMKAFIFDFAGVIAPGPLIGWIKKIPAEDPRKKLFKDNSIKWDLGHLNESEFYAVISQITGTAPEKVWDTYYENSLVHTDVVTLIKRLKKNYKIALFSDNFAPLLRKMLKKHELTELFDEILISSEHTMKKPDPKFFELMLSMVHAKKDEVIFIDDTAENIKAAQKLGIHSILFTDTAQLRNELKLLNISVN